MEHLTDFELILVGVCITLFCFGELWTGKGSRRGLDRLDRRG